MKLIVCTDLERQVFSSCSELEYTLVIRFHISTQIVYIKNIRYSCCLTKESHLCNWGSPYIITHLSTLLRAELNIALAQSSRPCAIHPSIETGQSVL